MHCEGISVIIPARNEAQSIAKVVKDVYEHTKSCGVPYEVIVVDDGSTDATRAQIPAHYAKVLVHEEPMGYGASLKTGIRSARFPWIFIIDGDDSYPAESIKDIVAALDESVDMVVGSRSAGGSHVSVTRGPARFILRALARYLTGHRIKDLNSGMRIFKKDLALRFINILPSQFSFTTTITLAALCNDYIVRYVDITYRRRKGASKISPFMDMVYFSSLIFRTVMYFNPLKVFVPLASVLFFAALIVFSTSKIIYGKIADITVLLLFLSSVQVLSIGLLADLIDKRIAKD